MRLCGLCGLAHLLADVARKRAHDAVFRDALTKAGLSWADADAAAFKTVIDKDRVFFFHAELVPELNLSK